MKINTMKLKLTALLLVLYTGLYAQNKIVLTAPRLDTSSLSNRINLKANTNLNNVNGVLSSTYGGAGSVSGILKANGSGVVSAAVAGTDYAPAVAGGYLPLSAGSSFPLTGTLRSEAVNGVFQNIISGTTRKFIEFTNDGAQFYAGAGGSGASSIFTGGAAYGSIIGSGNNTEFGIGTNAIVRYSISGSGNHDFKSGTANFGGALSGTSYDFSSIGQVGNIFTIKGATPFIRWNDASGTRLGYIQHATNLFYNADVGIHQFGQEISGTSLSMSGGGGFGGLVTLGSGYYVNAGSENRYYNAAGSNWAVIQGGSFTGSGLGEIKVTGGSGNGILVANNGNTLIKTTTESPNNEALQVAGSGLFTGAITASSSVTAGGGVIAKGITNDNTAFALDATNSSGSSLFKVRNDGAAIYSSLTGSGIRVVTSSSAGQLSATLLYTTAETASTLAQRDGSGALTATGFVVSSDLRFKDIITQDGDLYQYTLKADEEKKIHYGYIAQEVEKTLPFTVTTNSDGYKAVNYIEVHAIKIRELEKQIEELKKLIKK